MVSSSDIISDFPGSFTAKRSFQSKEDWLATARNVTADLTKNPSQTPYAWIFVEPEENKNDSVLVTSHQIIPQNAVVIGADGLGKKLYDGIYTVNGAGSKSGATIYYNGKVIKVREYEILVKGASYYYSSLRSQYSLSDMFAEKLRSIKTVVLLDDSFSMRGTPWDNAKQAVVAISTMLRDYNAEGLDLYFFNEESVLKGEKVLSELDSFAPDGVITIDKRLKTLSQDLLFELDKNKRPISVIVITDGAMEPGEENSLEDVIVEIGRSLGEKRLPAFSFGIQLVQIGDAPEVTKNLQRLDDKLIELYKIKDIVDTVKYNPEASGKQHLKMMAKILMGAMSRYIDQDQQGTDPLPK
ncbi:hypothetical protein QCA50_004932 [Cerrena zonata]|uniref:VWFA domain-containing protein n=1 Tax=Cerrena zonata TaxID=2478898 RepID=A0AAW0GMW8_9APHY